MSRVFKFYSVSRARICWRSVSVFLFFKCFSGLGEAAFWVFMAVVLPARRRVPAFTAVALYVGYLWGLSLFVVLSLLDDRVRRVLRGLAAELAYLAVVGTSILPPRSLLRFRLSRVVTPEVVSYLAMRIGGDELDVLTNSMLGIRLGGVPRCDLLMEVLPELHKLCLVLRSRGGEPLYTVLPDVVVPLAISASAAGFEEGDVLLTSYRATAYIVVKFGSGSKEVYI